MKPARLPDNEAERLEALRDSEVLDTPPEADFDDLAVIASSICGTPIALVSLVDSERQWFKARVGLDAAQTPRDVAFCAHAILGNELFIVPDTLQDSRFNDNPLVTGDPKIRFYAGAPLESEEGLRLGTLCVIDRQPRTLDESQSRALAALGRQVSAQLKLRRRAHELERLQRLKNEFVSLVSHELRTPMTSVQSAMRLLTDGRFGPLPAEAQKVLDIATRNASRLTRLVNDVLDLQKLEAGALVVARNAVPVAALCEEALDAVRSLAQEREITLEQQSEVSGAQVHGDHDRLVQVLVNLLGNALKFSPESGTITLRCTAVDNAQIRFEVRDEGPGFEAKAADRIFEPFEQLEQGTDKSIYGTGLGLAISRSIVEQHDGAIGAESKPGAGATFWFTVPAA